MAKHGNRKKSRVLKSREENFVNIKSGTKHGILAVVFFVFAILFSMAAFGKAGMAGDFAYEKLSLLLGVGYMLLPILFLILGYSFFKSKTPEVGWAPLVSSVIFLLSGLGILEILITYSPSPESSSEIVKHSGGLLGQLAASPLVTLFDKWATVIFLTALLIISMLVMFDGELRMPEFLKKLFGKKSEEEEVAEDDAEEEEEDTEEESAKDKLKKAFGVASKEPEPLENTRGDSSELSEESEMPIKKRKSYSASAYVPPPLSLLEEDKGKPNTGDIKANANIIKRTLANFGIEVEMDEVTVGPTITRYALKPAEGIKLSRILGLQNDLALALAAHPLRIEAPIPGKSLVGIEIPNKSKSIVGLGTLLADDKFANSPKPLTVALGRAISGRAVFGNLAKMPHCLVAGATGAGKSVTIHSIIASLLYRNGPDDLKFIMVDPKRVELTLYNNIPHLLTPVITNPKKAILALKWAAKEMDRRYDILESVSVRDIESYHNNVWNDKKSLEAARDGAAASDRLPYIVIIIDELADIMSSYPRELEAAIVRLAQMSRAVGIHLILSTQRPEVNVITGLIKANIPARVALRVSSQIDSRTILDAGGAEKLLGAGDMLYSSGEGPIERLQSAFISEGEVKGVVKYLADTYKDELSDDITLSEGSISADKTIFEAALSEESAEDDDEMYEEARAVVIESGKASTSYLQRKLKLGYARAARLMDKLEERGVIGPGEGAKPREVLERGVARDETGQNVI